MIYMFQILFFVLCIELGIYSRQKHFNMAKLTVTVFNLVLLYALMTIFVLE
jgi:hypothetical protein